MKRLLAILACLLIGLAPGAQTESFPAPDIPESTEAPQAVGSMELTLNGESMALQFDDNPLYSMRKDGYIQASFYGEVGELFYELYLFFPDGVQTGDIVSTQSAIASRDDETGILLYVTGQEDMIASIATQSAEGAYPAGASYRLTFADVRWDGSALTMTGLLEAVLADVDPSFNPLSGVRTLSASFSFTLDGGASGEIPAPESALPSAPPAAPAKLVTPLDAQKI